MLKKIVSYGLISVMSLGILAACGTTDEDTAEPTVTRAATSNAPAIATATAVGETTAATPGPQGGDAAAAPADGTAAAGESGEGADTGAAAGGPIELTVSAIDIAYEEETLEGPADTEFTITITNNGMIQHDFNIDELGIKSKMLNPGESDTITINAPAGDYTYYCSVPGHQAAGMEGVLTLSAGGGAAAAPAGEEAAAEGEEATAQTDGAAAPAGDQAAAGPVELTVSAIDIAYEEKTLEGPADTEFTITVTNNGMTQHDFVIDELGIKTAMLNPGQSETVTINAPAGEYTYYCSVPGHRPAGMEGVLTLSAGGGAAAAPAGEEAAADEGAATAQADGATAAEGEATAQADSAAAPAGDQAAAGPVELTVSAIDIAYEEKTLEGPADTEFTITVTNNGMTQHDFVIDELGIKTAMLNPGQSETVTINAPAGDYTYYCSVPGHRPAGMEGTLTLAAGSGAAAAPAGEETAEASPAASPAASPEAEGGTSAGATELTVSAIDIAYEEKTLEGAADTEITITITNNGMTQHDFVIDELGIKTAMLNPGQSETVTINAPAGEYTYYCSVPGHRPAGMEGTLTLS